MNLNGLSFNALPPIDLPFRFFLTAPVFVILCAFIILFSNEFLWFSRWQPAMLSVVHGFTLGFITMIMMGAMLQLLPVIGGVGITKPRQIALFSHVGLVLGTLSLMSNFLWPSTMLTIMSMLLLTLSLGIYIVALGLVLFKKLSQGYSIIAFRFSISALVITVLLGVLLLNNLLPVSNEIFGLIPYFPGKSLTNMHAIFGLVGWGSMMIVSVSFQVIPMFHVAPNFSKYISNLLPKGLFISLFVFIYKPEFALPTMVLFHGIFALSLLDIISKRKRKVPDNTILYWQLAAVSLIVFVVLFFLPESILPDFFSKNKTVLLAALFIYFYLVAVIQGMLLKILPFLSYTHLQQKCLLNFAAMQFLPHMHEFLNKSHGKWLFYLHLLTGLLLFSTIISPDLYWLFSLSLIVEFSWLLFLMIKTMRLYSFIHQKINSLGNE